MEGGYAFIDSSYPRRPGDMARMSSMEFDPTGKTNMSIYSVFIITKARISMPLHFFSETLDTMLLNLQMCFKYTLC